MAQQTGQNSKVAACHDMLAHWYQGYAGGIQMVTGRRTSDQSHWDALRALLRFVVTPQQRVLVVVPDGGDGPNLLDRNIWVATVGQMPRLRVTGPGLSDGHLEEPFDYIVLCDALASCANIGSFLHHVRELCGPHSRILVSSRENSLAALWHLIRIPLDRVNGSRNLLSKAGVESIMSVCGFERLGRRSLSGWRRRDSFAVYRRIPEATCEDGSLTVCLTCRNERDNIEPIIQAIPRLAERQEILIVEGHSDDGTRAEIERVMVAYPEKNVRLISQRGIGQGDAIREGFSRAAGRFIVLLEADMTSPPEDIIAVYKSLRAGFGEYVSGTRFAYPMAAESMPLLNRWGNWLFARYFSWLFDQHVSDVLCGIKGISKAHFDQIAVRWGQWGLDDPFGDFELLFGATQIGLKVGEIPVHYRPRRYGETKTRAFRHGAILLRLAARAFVAFRK